MVFKKYTLILLALKRTRVIIGSGELKISQGILLFVKSKRFKKLWIEKASVSRSGKMLSTFQFWLALHTR